MFYHRYIRKSHREKTDQKNVIESKQKLKDDRKKVQEDNVNERMMLIEEKLKQKNLRKQILA